ncbi:carbohydrate-binding protein [Streptomyces sp. NPDC058045]|uniref:carbohydrate-binding protein n=1 Tax=Streptomyces sp. NPDC058045 TaxID=3346311 RepID=UPI0036EF1FFC
MTAGNNGASTPEDEDPFGYLYADGQASGATPPSGGGGYGYPGPRSSHHQVRAVGERQYGQQAAGRGGYGYPPPAGQQTQQATASFGQVPQQTQQQPNHQPNAHYQAPETLPGGTPQRSAPRRSDGGRGRGPNTKGLLIGAIAVVAAVVIGIGAAMLSSGDDKDKGDPEAGPSSSAPVETAQPSKEPTKEPSAKPTVKLPKADAKALKLAGGTVTASDIDGATADGGVYVAGFNNPGASVTWTIDGVPKAKTYRFYVAYGVPGKAADATVTVNGKAQDRPLNMGNFAHAKKDDWEKGWTQTWATVPLNKGTNTITISCGDGNKCDANLDKVWLATA